MPFTQQEADELKMPLSLCNEWEAWMQEYWTQAINLFGNRKLHIEQGDNEIKFLKHYCLKTHFVNSNFLETEVYFKDTQLLSVRLVGKMEDLVAFVYCIASNHFKHVVLAQ
jgi:hypothetical protein